MAIWCFLFAIIINSNLVEKSTMLDTMNTAVFKNYAYQVINVKDCYRIGL